MKEKLKILIAIAGASGSIYAKIILDSLGKMRHDISVDIVMSDNAKYNWKLELEDESYMDYGYKIWGKNDFTAPFASGSSKYDAMIIIPCSMGVLGRIASGVSDDLMTRSADVFLKERRKLILVLRETPFSLIHIRNMETITLAGGIICPASPSFYTQNNDILSIVQTVTNRVLDLAGVNIEYKRWGD